MTSPLVAFSDRFLWLVVLCVGACDAGNAPSATPLAGGAGAQTATGESTSGSPATAAGAGSPSDLMGGAPSSSEATAGGGEAAGAPTSGTGVEPADGGASGSAPESAGAAGAPEVNPDPPLPLEPPIEPCSPAEAAAVELNVCPPGPFEAVPLIADEEEEILCTREVNWAEGPLWLAADATLYFSSFDETDAAGFYNGSLMTWRDGEGCVELWPDVGTNGLALGADGKLVTGRQVNRTLSRLDQTTGELCSLADTFEGKRFSSPNDVVVRPDGNIYFTDPAWNIGERAEELPQSLYRLDPEGNLSLIATYDDQRPNGVNLSPDGTLLYLATVDGIVVYDVDAAGLALNPRQFVADTNVDGMAVDCAGNVYASTGRVYSPAGELIGEFWGGTNLAFGGADGKTLYITGHGRLTSRHVTIPGMPY